MYDQQSSNKAFAYGRLEEAFRLATWVSKEKKRRVPVFPYFRHLYEGKPLEFDYLTDVRNKLLNFVLLCHCVVPENIHTPHMEGFLNCTPSPSRISFLVSYFHSKHCAFETPLPLGISINLPWGGN